MEIRPGVNLNGYIQKDIYDEYITIKKAN
jgi:hypothetical protein